MILIKSKSLCNAMQYNAANQPFVGAMTRHVIRQAYYVLQSKVGWAPNICKIKFFGVLTKIIQIFDCAASVKAFTEAAQLFFKESAPFIYMHICSKPPRRSHSLFFSNAALSHILSFTNLYLRFMRNFITICLSAETYRADSVPWISV